MATLKHPVGYLEKTDFSDSGELIGQLHDKPIFIMIQGDYCGGCTASKPDFQELANDGQITCMTIQLDGERQSERDIQSSGVLDNIYPNLDTIPSYVLLIKNQRIPYVGQDRSFTALKQFIKEYI